MLTMLSTVLVVDAAVILALLCSVLIFAPSDDPVRRTMDRRPTGEAAPENER